MTGAGRRFRDERGYFQEIFNEVKYPGFSVDPKQISVSSSHRGVVRGLHRSLYFKLVTVLSGRIIDILVDLDPESDTYKKWTSVELSRDSQTQVYIPPRFGHGFIALEDNSVVCYAQGGSFRAGSEMDVSIFDPELNIDIPQLHDRDSLIMSPKDRASPNLITAIAKWKAAANT